jgi:hypothetical protein
MYIMLDGLCLIAKEGVLNYFFIDGCRGLSSLLLSSLSALAFTKSILEYRLAFAS